LIDESLGDGGAAPVVADVRREGPLRRLVGPYAAIGGNSLLGRFLAAEFVSSIGDWLYLVAMLVVIAETADPIVLGIVGGARILPYVVLSGVGGILADRYDRRRILIATDLLRGSVMLALAAAILASAPIGVIVGLVVLAACGSSLAGPALSAYLPTLTRDESELGPANAAWATLDNVAFIIGPAVAGVLTALGGAAGAMLLNAASFAVVAIVLASLPAKARSAAGAAAGQVVAADLAEAAGAGPDASAGRPMLGTREIGRRIAAPILVDVGVSLVGGALGLATVLIATGQLNAGEAGTGWLNAATGVGGVLGGVAAGRLVDASPARVFAIGGIVAGIGLVALGTSDALLVAIALMAIASAGLLVLDVANSTYLQRVVDDESRGRASGLFHTVGSIAFAIGSFALPVAAAAVGIVPALVTVTVVAGGFVVAGIAVVAGRGTDHELDERTRSALAILQRSALGGLPVPQLAHAAGAATTVNVAADDVVIRQGEVADDAFVVASGLLEVTIDGAFRRRLGPGDLFGERGILLAVPRTATVRALEPTTLLRLDRPAFLALVRTRPRVSDELLALYGGRR